MTRSKTPRNNGEHLLRSLCNSNTHTGAGGPWRTGKSCEPDRESRHERDAARSDGLDQLGRNHIGTTGGSAFVALEKTNLRDHSGTPTVCNPCCGRGRNDETHDPGSDGKQTRLSMATTERLERVRRALHPRPVGTTPENTSQPLASVAH